LHDRLNLQKEKGTRMVDGGGVMAERALPDCSAEFERAPVLHETERTPRLDEIMARLRQGYYLDRHVTEKILKVLAEDIHLAEPAEG